jgi:hypothetical protein
MTAAALISKPLPLIGQRTLTAKEQLRRSQALACNLPEKNKPSCAGQVFLGMFFDGTGNNRDNDLPFHKQSNIVRLWRVHLDNTESLAIAPPIFWRKEYIAGVGTPFPEIGERGNATTGRAMANGGQSRIFWGLIQTINVMHRYVMSGKPLLSDSEAGKFSEGTGDGSATNAIAELKSKVAILKGILRVAKPTVTQLNISVFGFSRGAAQARTFCTWFYQLCEQSGDGYTFAGVPVRIYFLSIFDTVAAVGATVMDIFKDEIVSGHAAWAKGTLDVHAAIERCVHFVASHEVRSCFPLDSVRSMGKYPANCIEVVYPGVHSDIGGGYKPMSQGRSALPPGGSSYSFSAIVPCIDMHKEAISTGVPLETIKQMTKEKARDFTASSQTVEDYNAYIKADTVSGSVEAMFKQRMHRYRFYRYKKLATFSDEASKQGSPTVDLAFLRMTNGDFEEKCQEFKRKYKRIAEQIEKEKLNKLVNVGTTDKRTFAEKKKDLLKTSFHPEDLEMWEGMHRVGEIPEALVTFFDHYIHDSIAGFAQDGVREYKKNGRGHFRSRTVYDKGGK